MVTQTTATGLAAAATAADHFATAAAAGLVGVTQTATRLATAATGSFAAAAAAGLAVMQTAHQAFATAAAATAHHFAAAAALAVVQASLQTFATAAAAAAHHLAAAAAGAGGNNNGGAAGFGLVLEEELGSLDAGGHGHHQDCAEHVRKSLPRGVKQLDSADGGNRATHPANPNQHPNLGRFGGINIKVKIANQRSIHRLEKFCRLYRLFMRKDDQP